jgi:hypothetical protein
VNVLRPNRSNSVNSSDRTPIPDPVTLKLMVRHLVRRANCSDR